MDVTCDRCGTEYEFEETLVSPRGTTVKCTQCGHLFKVYRPEAAAASQLIGSHWTVRRVDGSNHQLPSLADLTRLISEGGFARDDEVSRTGKAWRRLGDVEELEPFFAEADRRGPSRARKSTQGPVLGLSQPKTGNTPAERSSPWPADTNAPSTARSPVAAGPRNSEPSDVRAAPAPEAVGGEQTRARSDEDDVETEQRPLPPRTSANPAASVPARTSSPSQPPAASLPATAPERPRAAQPIAAESGRSARPIEFPTDLEDRSELEPGPRSSLWLWVFAVLSTGLAISTWLLWPAPSLQSHASPPEDMSAGYLAHADATFASHRTEHFEQAITDYIKTLAFHESDPHVLSSLSRVYAVWAQEMLFASTEETEKGKAGQRTDSSPSAARILQLSEQAKQYAETAARKNPGNAEAEVALSDALRLTGNLVGARSELDRARASDRDPSAETLRVAALLSIDEARGDARAGLSLASQAVAKDPELIRAQLLLARCLIADGDLQGARHHVQLVKEHDRDHPGALSIEKLFERAEDVGREHDAAVTETSKTSENITPQFENLSHEGYISRGQSLLESGQVASAKRMFEQALFIRPNSTQAHSGLGYVALEKGRPQLAAEHFLSATRAGNDDALIGLADAYRRMSRNRDALRAYQNYLSRNPNGKQASIAQAQVERLSEETGRSKKSQ